VADRDPEPTFMSSVYYRDPLRALDWLEAAFGFERTMVITEKDGRVTHSEMSFGNGIIMVGPEWSDDVASPASIGGKNTQQLHVQLKAGIDDHCKRAEAAGAVILMPPSDQFYGARTYRARDPEGHVWAFGQPVRRVSREEAEQVTGFKIEGWR
jgi:uncharacterized glyoxalase superfamily protein PhnB